MRCKRSESGLAVRPRPRASERSRLPDLPVQADRGLETRDATGGVHAPAPARDQAQRPRGKPGGGGDEEAARQERERGSGELVAHGGSAVASRTSSRVVVVGKLNAELVTVSSPRPVSAFAIATSATPCCCACHSSELCQLGACTVLLPGSVRVAGVGSRSFFSSSYLMI
uniref:Uncharacterized protein n=1 Tax=Oryza sativa subsp. japonica TaxID=39947 RepID=Q6K8Q9_ORYSJ|nr:hypothetical protein [Oryza sativa Japonica Group]